MATLPTALPQIAVADDDPEMRAYIAHALRRRADVYEAADGEAALRLARSLTLDLVIADIQMPGLGGLELCLALRADPRTQPILLLLVSGETQLPPPCADGFLAKPFNAASLRAAVARVLSKG